jgi:hypothetical protein
MAIAFLHESRYHSGHVSGMDAHLPGFSQGVVLNATCQAHAQDEKLVICMVPDE